MPYEEEEKEPQDDAEILEDDREYLVDLINSEEGQRSKMLDDLRFCTLDQWDKDIRNERESDKENGPRPCLTIDKINQYIVQVVNDLRQGKPGINVRPQDDAGDVELAKILKGIIRNIEDQSSADIAYATAGENAVKVGLGYVRIITEYTDDESFDQDLRIKAIPNTFSVYLGPHTMPDGSDAECAYIIEAVPIDKFREEFPDAKYQTADFEGIDASVVGHFRTDETITVIEKYELESSNETLHFLADGTRITDSEYKKWPDEAGVKPTVQKSRTTTKKQLRWRKMTAVEILDRRDLPGKWIPVAEEVGRETWVDGKRVVWGLVRPAKDSLRMYNYWASTLTEKFGLAPKTPFIGAKGQFEGLEERWKQANKKNFAYLEYNAIDVNGNAIPAPQRQGPTPMEAAYFHQMQVIEHDVQTSLGMFKAATGESESQQSGRAILALQKESDTGTYHFGANQGIMIRHVGRILIDLIPHYYDTKKIIRIVGDDGELQTVHLNPDQEQPVQQQQDPMTGAIKNVYNPTIGKYDVSISVGPSYNTKRMEDQAVFVEMAKGATDPGSASVLRYLVMRNSDSPGSQEAANVLKAMLPPQALQALSSKQPLPPEALAEMQKMRAAAQQMQEGMQKLQQENQQLKSGAQVQAMKVQADSTEARAKFMQSVRESAAKQQLAAQEAQATSQLESQKLNSETQLAIFKARLEAATKIEVAQIAAKGSLVESAIQAEQDANVALSQSLNPSAETTSTAEPQVPEHLSKILDELTKATTILTDHATKPKTIHAKSSSGNTLTATVK
jgi:hypothetical protein